MMPTFPRPSLSFRTAGFPCACRKPRSGRIGDAARQPGRATRCVRSAAGAVWSSGAIERGAGECAIVVAVGDQAPAFVRLTLYIGLASLALRIERGEGKVEVMLARLAGIDGAAQELASGTVHVTAGRQALLRAPAAAAPLRGRAPLMSSATLRRSASMRFTTRCGGAKLCRRS